MAIIRSLLVLMLLLSATGAQAFGFADVVARAQALAAEPYVPPTAIPRVMRDISYDDYQGIRFDPEQRLWRRDASPFQIMLTPAGLFYTHPVRINLIEGRKVRPLPFDKKLFSFASAALEKKVPARLGFAGFRLTYPLEGADATNQFLVFAGASYFRGVGRGNAWGTSGRGIAIDTGLMSGEEFPSFVEFWLEKPKQKAKSMRFYGLLDGESLAGAYAFVVHPGDPTRLEVEARLFPRRSVKLAGLAPLTSMFFYGENTARPRGEWRPEVHDSDGLLIHDRASGEWLWRPLLNPRQLQRDHLHVGQLGGFGLLQRDGNFNDYQDLEARYEKRPSAWVQPRDGLGQEAVWQRGQVVLVQLPTRAETNDNIVAFWTPGAALRPDAPLHLAYTVAFGGPRLANEPLARAIHSFVGDGNIVGGGSVAGAVRLVVDFAGGPLDGRTPQAAVEAEVTGTEGTEILEHFTEYNDGSGSWRLSVLARPAAEAPLALRAFLREGTETLSETWTYRLPIPNDILETDP